MATACGVVSAGTDKAPSSDASPADKRNEYRGDADAAGECVARSRGGGVAVNRCAKSLFHLRCGPGKLNPAAAGGERRNGKAFLREPRGDGGYVGGGVREPVGKLRRREPLVIRAVSAGLLRLKEAVERLLLGRRRLEQKQHAIQMRVGGRDAEIEAGWDEGSFGGGQRRGGAGLPVSGETRALDRPNKAGGTWRLRASRRLRAG